MEFVVPNMSCNHCAMAIDKALKNQGIVKFDIDVANHTVTVHETDKPNEEVKAIIESAGYSVK